MADSARRRLDRGNGSSPQLRLPIDSAVELPGRLRDLGLPTHLPVTLHANARTMVSLHPRRGLRVHQGYAHAPNEVLLAIVRWARPHLSRAERRAAARELLRFRAPEYLPAPARPPRHARDAPEPGDRRRLDRLHLLHQHLNARWFDGALKPIAIRLSSRMRRKLGHYEPASQGPPAIAISRRHLRRDGWARVEGTLLHGMVHQWQDETGLPVDHGPSFRRKARLVGIEPRAVAPPRVGSGRPPD